MTSEEAYQVEMMTEEFLEKYRDIIEQRAQHDNRHDKRLELAQESVLESGDSRKW